MISSAKSNHKPDNLSQCNEGEKINIDKTKLTTCMKNNMTSKQNFSYPYASDSTAAQDNNFVDKDILIAPFEGNLLL